MNVRVWHTKKREYHTKRKSEIFGQKNLIFPQTWFFIKFLNKNYTFWVSFFSSQQAEFNRIGFT